MFILLSNITVSLNRFQFFERKKGIHLTKASQVTIIVKNNSLEVFWDFWHCLHALMKTVCFSSEWQHTSDWTLALWVDYLIFFLVLWVTDYRESLLVNLALAAYEIKNIFCWNVKQQSLFLQMRSRAQNWFKTFGENLRT